MVFKHFPDYSCLKVFGYLFFPLFPSQLSHKLAPNLMPCVFLGCDNSYKGYKCLFLQKRNCILLEMYPLMNMFFLMLSTQLITTPTSLAPLSCTINLASFHDFQWKPKIINVSDPFTRASLPTESTQDPLLLAPLAYISLLGWSNLMLTFMIMFASYPIVLDLILLL